MSFSKTTQFIAVIFFSFILASCGLNNIAGKNEDNNSSQEKSDPPSPGKSLNIQVQWKDKDSGNPIKIKRFTAYLIPTSAEGYNYGFHANLVSFGVIFFKTSSIPSYFRFSLIFDGAERCPLDMLVGMRNTTEDRFYGAAQGFSFKTNTISFYSLFQKGSFYDNGSTEFLSSEFEICGKNIVAEAKVLEQRP